MMDRNLSDGDGYSPEGRAAAWQRLTETGVPPRGEGCPLTLELVDLARGRLEEPRATEVRLHLDQQRCPHCVPRFEAQGRALARLRAAAQTTPGGLAAVLRRAGGWRSRELAVSNYEPRGDGAEHRITTWLEADDGEGELRAVLYLRAAERGGGYSLNLQLPRPGPGPEQERWAGLASRTVVLTLRDASKREWQVSLDLFLPEGGEAMESRRVPMPFALQRPEDITRIGLSAGTPRPRFDCADGGSAHANGGAVRPGSEPAPVEDDGVLVR